MKISIRLVLTLMLSSWIQFSFCQENSNAAFSKTTNDEILELMEEGDIPGLSLVMIDGDQVVIKNFGHLDLEENHPVNSKTLFEIGSCSKAFTATAITYLAEQNKIDIDDKVSKYIPWFEVYFEEELQEISLRQLLHHTSGIPWQTIALIPESNDSGALLETIQQLVGLELSDTPGKRFEYATINYDVLALIIEKVSGQSFETYVQDNIIDPLNLKNTTIGEPKDIELMSPGYKIGFFKPRAYQAPRYRGNAAAGYVISNAEDMTKWLKFQMGLVASDLSNIINTTHQRDKTVPLHEMSSYARGWNIALDGSGEIWHAGLNPNYTAYVSFRPEEKLGVAVLANSNSNYTSAIGNKIIKLMAGEEVERELDPGDGGDKTYSGITVAMAVYILVVIVFIAVIMIDLVKGKKKYESLTWKKIGQFTLSIFAVFPFLFAIYILPAAIAGFSWEAIVVWTPMSFSALIVAILIAIVISYLASFLSLCFPESNKYKRKIPQVLLMSILSGLSNVGVIIMVTSAIGTDTALKYLVFYYALIIVVYLLGRRFVQINLIELTRGLVFELRVKLIDKIFSTSYQKFEKINRGRVYTALNDDVNTIGQSTNLFVMLITSIITAVGAFLYLASIAFWATLLTIILIGTISTLYYFASQSTNRYFQEARNSRDVFMRLINGLIDGFKEISLHRNKKLEYKKDVAASAHEYKVKTSTADIRFVNAFLVGESLLVILLGLVSIGMAEIFPNVKLYTIMSFVIVLLYLIGPVNGILGAVPALMNLKIAWDRVQEFIEEIPANLDLNQIPEAPLLEVVKIEAKDVEFKYQNEGSNEVFGVGPINLEVSSGEVLFIIGGNGSGKTTLAKLLTGLYEPESGQIMINNKPLKNYELSEYFSTVFSPSFLFEKLYNVDIQEKQDSIGHYLSLLDLDEKVTIAEDGYNTINLSGGQRKRLALLQCYLEDSPIYLFDEWAADQDPGYRNFFYRTLIPEMKKQGKIVIAITHDDQYFDVADKVMMMKLGKIEVSNSEGVMSTFA